MGHVFNSICFFFFLSLLGDCKVHCGTAIGFTFQSSKTEDSKTNDADVQVLKDSTLFLKASALITEDIILEIKYEEESNTEKNTTDIVTVSIGPRLEQNDSTIWTVKVKGEQAGHVTVVAGIKPESNSSDVTYNTSEAFVRFQVYRNHPLVVFSDVIGWFYFVAWSVSFYPQVYLNFRRKSVIGLNFDFLALNFMGFLCYSAYNVGLFWIDPVQDEFRDKNPHDIVPVEINDVIFALHALLLTIITLAQVFIYERGGQKVSIPARLILGACALAIVVFVIVAAVPAVKTFKWLEMVSSLSYVKLVITIIKYIPQAFMNFKRKSTVGWSIGNVLLDFTGGYGSIIQMFVLAYNYNDWQSIFLNPVKFWLGALSILFDIVFVVQHYCLYRYNNQLISGYQTLNDGQANKVDEPQPS